MQNQRPHQGANGNEGRAKTKTMLSTRQSGIVTVSLTMGKMRGRRMKVRARVKMAEQTKRKKRSIAPPKRRLLAQAEKERARLHPKLSPPHL